MCSVQLDVDARARLDRLDVREGAGARAPVLRREPALPSGDPKCNRPSARRAWLRRIVGLAMVGLMTCAAAELALRVPLVPLPNPLATYLFSCYERINPSRYVFAPLERLGLWFHRPDFEGRCYFNGHHWTHRSDAFGWRNPRTWKRVDVAILGDSMVYGHGVEERDTIAHRLRELTGLRVANLGITGGHPAEYLAVLRNFAIRLRPRVIVVFFFANDLSDLRATRSAAALAAFADHGAAPELRVFPRSRLLADVPTVAMPSPWDASYLVRVWRFAALERASRTGSLSQALPSDSGFDARGVPSNLDCRAFDHDHELELRYVSRAIEVMRASTVANHEQLVLGYLPLPTRTTTDVCFGRALRRWARTARLPFSLPVLQDGDGAPLPYTRLARDGHLTGEGAGRVAADLAATLRASAALE